MESVIASTAEQKTMTKEAKKAEKAQAKAVKDAERAFKKATKAAASAEKKAHIEAEKAAAKAHREAERALKAASAEPKRSVGRPKKASSTSSGSVAESVTVPFRSFTSAGQGNHEVAELRMRLAAMEAAYAEATRQLDAIRSVMTGGTV